MKAFLLSLGLVLSLAEVVAAQQFLLLEKANSPRTQKIGIGSTITYRLDEDPTWLDGKIVEIRTDQQLLAIDDYYLDITRIKAIRQRREWVIPTSVMLTTFGLSWSGFALIGNATDGNPDTNYKAKDAIVTAVSAGTGIIINRLFRYRMFKIGPNRRLRLVDVSF